MPVITIRGQMGSWASEIGELIAQKLRVDYVDREIIASVANRLRQPQYSIENKEMPPTTLFGRIAEAMSSGYVLDASYSGMYMPAWEIPLNDTKFLSGLQHVIRELAKSEAIVIRGRGSQFILKDMPGTYHVLVVAPLETRVMRVMAKLKLNEMEARNEIARFDGASREFIRRYFREDISDPVNYDIILNTQHLSIEAAALSIIDAVLRMCDGRRELEK